MESETQSQKQGGDRLLNPHSKRRREDSNIFGNYKSLFHITIDDVVDFLPDLVRRLVAVELERQLYQRSIINETGAKFFHLVFKNELPNVIFSNSKIKAKDNTPIEIALYDIRSKSIVVDGPLSSIKVEIYVLKGDFDSEDWTPDQFKDDITRQRDNKGKLLAGDTVIKLKNGVGYIPDMGFTDNSCWTRTGRFRLGVKVVQSNSNEKNIKEGRSKPFRVKDNRGELNQKHYPPSPNDELWRLTRISKDGKIHDRLSSRGINTVKDLLQLHETDPSSLQEKFGQISKKKREAIIEHAKTCVAEVTFNGQNYRSPNALNSDQKQLVDTNRNVQDSIPVDDTSSATLQCPGQCAAPQLQALDLPTAWQDQLEKREDFSQPSTSKSHIGEADNQAVYFEDEYMEGMFYPSWDHIFHH